MADQMDILTAGQEPEKEIEGFDVVYLNPECIHFGHDGDNLTFTAEDGRFFPRVTLRRCFPLSNDDNYLIVRSPDTEDERGLEIGLISQFDRLDADSQAAVRHELKLHYFVPLIKKIVDIHEEFDFLYWKVITDRGYKEFITRSNVIVSVRQVSANRWLVIDINQSRYEINYEEIAADPHGKKLIDKWLTL